MPAAKDAQPLAPETAAQLAEFARACKAAARAVTLYPAAHPAIKVSLGRLAEVVSRATASRPLTLAVLPDNLLIEGRSAPRTESAIVELAQLLHDHLVGGLTIHSSPDADLWRPFLLLLARPPADIRIEGGFARLWAATGVQHVEIQEIDYAEVLRERAGTRGGGWDEIIKHCLQDGGSEFDENTLQALLDVAGDPERLAELAMAIEQEAGGSGLRAQTAALLRMLRGIVDIVSRTDPARLEPLLQNLAAAVGGLSPDLVLELLAAQSDRAEAAADLVLQVVHRMSDGTIAGLVAKSVVAEGAATGRLAQAFQALVPDTDRRRRLLDLARDEVAASPLGEDSNFPELWKNASEMLTSYSDESFVSEGYARELSSARTQAIEVERVSDDPPERISTWLTTVSDSELRAVDLQLLLDLLTIEENPEHWRDVTQPVVLHIEDLLLVGDLEAALQLIDALLVEAKRDTPRKAAAVAAIDRVVASMMRHLVVHVPTLDDQMFGRIKRLCYDIGPVVIKPLAEALSVEQRGRSRQRLTELLLGFGAAGRQSVERLRNSANPAVRRTAVYLLREFGGSDALPDLTKLLDDAEPNIQREAVGAILAIGTDDAYAVLERALASGSERSRNSLMLALVAMRDERAAPLFEYIVRHVDSRGALRAVYLHAIESLGTFRTEHAVELLKDALYRGQWFAPFRTAALRRTAAGALRRIGTRDALQVLEEAAAHGSRGVRAAVRAGQSSKGIG